MKRFTLRSDTVTHTELYLFFQVGKIGRIKMQVKTGAGVVKGYGSIGRIPSSPLVEKRLSQSGAR